ncbi:hypothetical protein J5J09_07745 [Ciceribacter sp. L1K22]|nr:hypothetical protein [Ciceribacter sp. L1K22]
MPPAGWVSRCFPAVALAVLLAVMQAPASHALSELNPGSTTKTPASPPTSPVVPVEPEEDDLPAEGMGIPDPDPLVNRESVPGEEADVSTSDPTVEYLFDIEAAPEPVRRMRALIVEAAASGDIERLRPLLNPGPNQTQIPVVGDQEGLVETLKSLSGDSDGVEILAILLDILQTGFVRIDAGTSDEVYVWPYFAEKQIGNLTPPEKVELLRIVTAGDLEGMQEYGNYNFFRVGITPDGEWKFFTAGD